MEYGLEDGLEDEEVHSSTGQPCRGVDNQTFRRFLPGISRVFWSKDGSLLCILDEALVTDSFGYIQEVKGIV